MFESNFSKIHLILHFIVGRRIRYLFFDVHFSEMFPFSHLHFFWHLFSFFLLLLSFRVGVWLGEHYKKWIERAAFILDLKSWTFDKVWRSIVCRSVWLVWAFYSISWENFLNNVFLASISLFIMMSICFSLEDINNLLKDIDEPEQLISKSSHQSNNL